MFVRSMNRTELARKLGVSASTVKSWQEPGGILHGVAREPGVYTTADLAVGAALLELQRLLGERSPKPVEYACQLAPRIRAAVAAGQAAVLRVRIPGSALVLDVDLAVLADGTVRQSPETADAHA